MRRNSALLALLFAGVMIDSASAHGLLRRLLSRPRVACEPPITLAPVPDTLEGRVTFKGELPKIASLKANITRHNDRQAILKAPKEEFLDPTWRIDPKTRGVANVCVFIKRPANGKVPIGDEDKVRREPIVMDAPFTFFRPHMAAVYPEWFDGENRGDTGQRFVFKNSSEVAVNFRLFGVGSRSYPDGSSSFPHRTEMQIDLKPLRLPYSAQCDIHPWSSAKVWVFDHPYFAITKADGTFVIPRVPVGMEVRVQAWHEDVGWLLTTEGKAMTLQQGKNVLDFEVSIPK